MIGIKITNNQLPAAARPDVPAHNIEENASAMVATFDEV